jgi:hypothetical protein
MAIEALKNDEKPVLTVANTMESFLRSTSRTTASIPNDPVKINFNDLLHRYLERTRTITIKKPFSRRRAKRHYLTDESSARSALRATRLRRRRFKRPTFGACLSRRSTICATSSRAPATRSPRSPAAAPAFPTPTRDAALLHPLAEETSIAGRRKAIKDFNGGEAHAMILNQAGATGLSIHAGEKFKDQRRRHMMLVQPEANVDTHMQMLGRVHRTGQVIEPNTRSSSPTFRPRSAPRRPREEDGFAQRLDHGGARRRAHRRQRRRLHERVRGRGGARHHGREPPNQLRTWRPVSYGEGQAANEGAMRKLTGRIPLLPIKRQEDLYERSSAPTRTSSREGSRRRERARSEAPRSRCQEGVELGRSRRQWRQPVHPGRDARNTRREASEQTLHRGQT